jgi:hypothetical protein
MVGCPASPSRSQTHPRWSRLRPAWLQRYSLQSRHVLDQKQRLTHQKRLTHPGPNDSPAPSQACSSVGEHRPDTARVGGSNPPMPTIFTATPHLGCVDTAAAEGYNRGSSPFLYYPRARARPQHLEITCGVHPGEAFDLNLIKTVFAVTTVSAHRGSWSSTRPAINSASF